MNWVDLGIIIALALAAVCGWRQGLVPALAILVALFIGLTLGSRLAPAVGSLIFKNNDSSWLLGFAIIAVIAIVAGVISGKILEKVVRLLFLGWADRLAGLIFSVGVAVILLSSLVVAAVSIEASPDWLQEGVKDAMLASQLAESGEWVRPGWSWAQEKARERLASL